MRNVMPSLAVVALLAGCAVAPAPVVARVQAPVVVAAPAYPSAAAVARGYPPRFDPYCQEERREAQASQRVATREAREAAVYGGRRQSYQAAAAQSEANRQRAQAQRAC